MQDNIKRIKEYSKVHYKKMWQRKRIFISRVLHSIRPLLYERLNENVNGSDRIFLC